MLAVVFFAIVARVFAGFLRVVPWVRFVGLFTLVWRVLVLWLLRLRVVDDSPRKARSKSFVAQLAPLFCAFGAERAFLWAFRFGTLRFGVDFLRVLRDRFLPPLSRAELLRVVALRADFLRDAVFFVGLRLLTGRAFGSAARLGFDFVRRERDRLFDAGLAADLLVAGLPVDGRAFFFDVVLVCLVLALVCFRRDRVRLVGALDEGCLSVAAGWSLFE